MECRHGKDLFVDCKECNQEVADELFISRIIINSIRDHHLEEDKMPVEGCSQCELLVRYDKVREG